jgi:hypothetical protein
MISSATTLAVLLLHQYPQTAQALPCNGYNGKEYCTGYLDGAIQAHRDFKTGDDIDVDHYRCTGSVDYCNGYNTEDFWRNNNNESSFLNLFTFSGLTNKSYR